MSVMTKKKIIYFAINLLMATGYAYAIRWATGLPVEICAILGLGIEILGIASKLEARLT